MFDLPPVILTDIISELSSPPAMILNVNFHTEETITVQGTDLSFGILRRTESEITNTNTARLSFSGIPDGSTLGLGDNGSNISEYFTDRYGSSSIMYVAPDIFEVQNGFLPDNPLRWPEEIRNPERSQFLSTTFGINNLGDFCIAGSEIEARIESSNAVDDLPEITTVIDVALALDGFSDTTTSLYGVITDPDNDILVCAFADDADGRFYSEQRIINVNYANAPNAGIPFLEASEDVFLETYRHLLITGFEEAAHAYHYFETPESNLAQQPAYSSTDTVLFWLAEEASVKVTMAVDAVREAYQLGDNALFEEMMDVNNSETEMVQYLLAEVRENGLMALEDPEALFHTFTLFFQNEISMAQYLPFYNTPEVNQAIASNESDIPIPVSILEQSYGRTIGNEGQVNYLEGRFEAVRDIIDLMPEDSGMANWINGISSETEFSCTNDNTNPDLGMC